MIIKYLILSSLFIFNQIITNVPRWKLDIEISESANMIFGQLDDIATDSNNFIYVLDSKDRVIYKFDEDGKYLDKIGRPGQGPGEFEMPCSIFINSKDWLYVLDKNRRIEVYDAESKYRKTIRIIVMPTGNRRNIVTDNQDNIYISGYYRNNNTILAKYNNLGEIVKYYDLPITEYGKEIFSPGDNVMINQYLVGGTICFDDEANLYCSYSWPYIIKKIARAKDTISKMSNKSEYSWTPFIFRTDQPNGKMFGESTYSVRIFFINKEYLVNSIYVIDWIGNPNRLVNLSDAQVRPDKYFKIMGKYTSLEIYNKDLKCIDKIMINEKVHIYCADKEGRILGIKYNEEDVPSIVRYKIDIAKDKVW